MIYGAKCISIFCEMLVKMGVDENALALAPFAR